jgi:hypothetical protein
MKAKRSASVWKLTASEGPLGIGSTPGEKLQLSPFFREMRCGYRLRHLHARPEWPNHYLECWC